MSASDAMKTDIDQLRQLGGDVIIFLVVTVVQRLRELVQMLLVCKNSIKMLSMRME